MIKPFVNSITPIADSFGRETQFFGPNSNLNAQIKYLLPKRHTFGKMTMEIFDENGKSVINLSPGKSKGMNFVSWNYRMKQPKVAKGKTHLLEEVYHLQELKKVDMS